MVLFVAFLNAAAVGMDYRWGPIDERKNTDKNHNPVLYLTGEIKTGDSERFRAFLRRDFEKYAKSMRLVRLSSDGGDILEALKIGKIVRAMYAEITVLETCASACFLIYVSAVNRASFGRVGIHRPYFEQTYFSALSASEAEARHSELAKLVDSFLYQNSVPRHIIEKMNRSSSKSIHWLTGTELEEVGRYPAWYEEFLLAKCKKAPKDIADEVRMAVSSEPAYVQWLGCVEKSISPELQTQLLPVLNAKNR
ncbi:MAG: hypothetical protein WBO10_02775 [Pyrinomonadaceae bacterium]